MHRAFISIFNYRSLAALALMFGVGNSILDAQTTQPATPLLHQLNDEVRSLYQSVKPGLVCVELPPPRWAQALGNTDNLVQKWNNRLSADVREKLHAAGHREGDLDAVVATTEPTTTPSNIPATEPNQSPASGEIVLRRSDGGLEVFSSGDPTFDAILGSTVPRVMGIVLDDAGHVLVPVFIEKDAVQERPIIVLDSNGNAIRTSFVGSDRQTSLTVLMTESPIGHPLKLAGNRPADGTLIMLLSSGGESDHLIVWPGDSQERGMVLNLDGNVQGFVRFGQFLCGDAIRPLAEQLVREGHIRRATLGVMIIQADAPDGRHALKIEQVMDHSAAATAGLRPGDFICALSGTPVSDIPNFSAAIAETDGKADLQVLRSGEQQTITVELRPK
ncbi:MAG: PDZ domain-containing protein [Phycisphaerae bacterium]|nr:PDZ domain-containing protein [Phycisphaerae bacterium]